MTTYQQKIYQENIETHRATAKKLEQQRNLISTIRVLVFIIGVVGVVYGANERNSLLFFSCTVISFVLFLIFLSQSAKVKSKLRYHRALVEINEEETVRAKGDFKNEKRGTAHEAPSNHPYTYDLDIFGPISVLSLINRTVSYLGNEKLAAWLMGKANKKELLSRQEAIKELTPMLDWRQGFQVQGMLEDGQEKDISPLLKWLKEENKELATKGIKIMSIVGPLIALVLIIACVFTSLPASFLFIGLIGNFWVISKVAKSIGEAIDRIDDSVNALKNYARLMQAFEEGSFQSEKLKTLQAILTKNDAGSTAIQRLSTILYHLELRKNAYFYVLVIVPSLYDVHWMVRLEDWKKKYAHSITEWLEVIAEVEALQSLAGFAYANEDYTYPEFSDEAYCIEALGMGHPLLPSDVRVSNDFTLKGKGSTGIITGSNMSGKSTFERTLGVNMVLAFAGAPICAKNLKVSLLQVFTCMRVQDSLEENVSGFYAELRRIEQLLQVIENSEEGVFYFLDEILKGTNSKDRCNGARALIKQLAKTGSFGLITTHDLELGELATQFPDRVRNFSFNSQIKGNKLLFDYQISEGVCHSFSATKLMQGIGIVIDD